ncbi:DUF58 domain-containing protein [Verrucomicrobiaceae bacterium N1E253]|uniref:DUF58 domain-containing protein n=1 Tax=Oceaniferula marina TaxID=2748318 RepID=A0A851GR43_9BACT|nr:DUF58 domain-containing protein [Oceaniferula marina]NWK57270.1 DUF58 domain-containing protein [Oceaniferula marina]
MSLSPAQLNQLQTQANICTERLGLPLRSQIWRGKAGEFQGAGTGSSIDFQDHRAYVPGDDPRHINWQAYARTGNYSMKLYREEVRPSVELLLDVSNSMFFDPEKEKRCAELLYFCCLSAAQSGASIRTQLVQGDHHQHIPEDAINSHRWLEPANKMAASDPAAPPQLQNLPLLPHSVRILISDLLFDTDPAPILQQLTRQHGKAILLVPYLQQEANPDWSGHYEFVDAEHRGAHPHRIDPSILKKYRQAYRDHFTQWHQAARRFNTPMAKVASEPELLTALNTEALKSGALTTN